MFGLEIAFCDSRPQWPREVASMYVNMTKSDPSASEIKRTARRKLVKSFPALHTQTICRSRMNDCIVLLTDNFVFDIIRCLVLKLLSAIPAPQWPREIASMYVN